MKGRRSCREICRFSDGRNLACILRPRRKLTCPGIDAEIRNMNGIDECPKTTVISKSQTSRTRQYEMFAPDISLCKDGNGFPGTHKAKRRIK